MRLYAAIMTQKTDLSTTKSLNGLDKAKSKVEELEKQVDAAWQAMTIRRQADPVWDEEQFVFLAPEYFFSNQQHAQDRFFSQDVKRYVLAKLAAMGKKYPKLVIVPGTVLWTKNAYEKQVNRFIAPSNKPTIGNRGQTTTLVPNQKRINSAKNRINQNHQQFPVVAFNRGDWSHSGPKNGQEGTMNVQLDYLDNADTLQTRIAQNVAYICLGKQILKYHKVGNYKEVNGEQGTIVFEPGALRGQFKIGDVRYALEVCMDHALDVINSNINSSDDQPHIRIIVSDFVNYKKNSKADDLVVLHSSTIKPGTYNTQTGPMKVDTDPVVLGPGCKLVHTKSIDNSMTLFTVEIDNKKHGISRKNAYVLTDSQLQAPKHIYEELAV